MTEETKHSTTAQALKECSDKLKALGCADFSLFANDPDSDCFVEQESTNATWTIAIKRRQVLEYDEHIKHTIRLTYTNTNEDY